MIPNRKKKWCEKHRREAAAAYMASYRNLQAQDRKAEELRRAVARTLR